ncbi:abc transporter a family member 1 [Quercus suber]|uniref:Abc transporter a family member 1 n=1 Tax=Quercus suber TaxID=58331 RepID=A0AAW0JGZ8_QUESU
MLNFEGHNRAGESTKISMLVDLLTPTSGDFSVFWMNIIMEMLQQVLDAFIMISGQRTYSTSQIIEIPSVQSSDNASLLMLPLMQFSPSNIRIAPFLTPKYTDDEFWYIMKEVMGVLYVSSGISLPNLLPD